MSEPLWQPSEKRIADANLTRFISAIADDWGFRAEGFDALHRWSVAEKEKFWRSVWSFTGVVAETQGAVALADGTAMPGAKWFPEARLNFAENLLRRRDDGPAIIFRGEDRVRRSISRSELYDLVSRIAQALEAEGVGVGDRVAGYLPNIPEAVAAMLAASSLGAIWSSCSPDFGLTGILDRFGQIEPKVLFTSDGYFYNGTWNETLGRAREAVDKLPSLRREIVFSYGDETPVAGDLPHGVTLDEFIRPFEPREIPFKQLPFDHPLYILYSSGTTGPPKCIVHGQGGTLLQHLKEQRLQTDVKPDDRVFYFTTLGWMMWNWLVSALASEATVLLYDGAPFHPGPEAMFDFAQETRMTHFGTSAKYIDAVKKSGIVSCFVLGNPIGPVWRGEIQAPGLGMDVHVYDDSGRPVTGEKGELVCASPFPPMPVRFWNDADGAKYHAAYFERFPGVWCHGDYAEITEHGGMIIYGRSDAVLNPGGVRIGTAEIYRQVEQMDEVEEGLAVGQEWQGDTRVVLFVRLREGVDLDDGLIDRIRKRIRANCTPRHVPGRVIQVADIPRTKSGKIVELAVREVIHEREVKNVEALANPEALALFRDRAELKD